MSPKSLQLSFCGVVGWGGVHSHFHVQPNYSVEVVLWCVVLGVGVGVVTILILFILYYYPQDR